MTAIPELEYFRNRGFMRPGPEFKRNLDALDVEFEKAKKEPSYTASEQSLAQKKSAVSDS